MLKNNLEKMAKSAKKLESYKVVSQGYMSSPFVDMHRNIGQSELMSCFYMLVQSNSEISKTHLTVIAHHNDEFILRCGDPFFEGKITEKTVNKMIISAFEKSSTKNYQTFYTSLKRGYKIAKQSTTCVYNSLAPAEKPEDLCAHVKNMFAHVKIDEVMSTLEDNYESGYYGGSRSLSSMKSKLPQLFHRYAFKKPILLEGDKGSGKTYFVTKWGKNNGVPTLFIGGHEQFESIDFLGHYIQKEDQQLVWKDGPLTEAFRIAANGEKVLLIIDEMLRIPQRELNILVSALSPIESNYVLRTSRASEMKEGIATEETLHAPVENLWIVGTTNVGAGYAVEEIDDALADRFKTLRKDTTESDLKSILDKKATERSFSNSCVEPLMKFYQKMSRLKKSAEISKLVNIRHLSEAIEFADCENAIVDVVYDTMLTWVDRDVDGTPNMDQVQLVEMTIEEVWKLS